MKTHHRLSLLLLISGLAMAISGLWAKYSGLQLLAACLDDCNGVAWLVSLRSTFLAAGIVTLVISFVVAKFGGNRES